LEIVAKRLCKPRRIRERRGLRLMSGFESQRSLSRQFDDEYGQRL
jgi:hypothetical protein